MAETKRILIWGKTYPELSTSYRETVCTGGCTEDGRPIRIYPVPIRYLPHHHRYTLFDWIEAPVEPSTKDVRPESFRITDPRWIRVVGHIGTGQGWRERRRVIFRDPSWRFECLNDLQEARKRQRTSMGLIRVGAVDNVRLVWKKPAQREEHEEKLAGLKSNLHVFGEIQRDLQFLPFAVRLHWRCERLEGPNACRGHTATVMDWGLGELGRRDGADQALAKMREIADLAKKDLYLFMGNMKAHQHVFGIVALWYPKQEDVLKYPVEPSFFDPEPPAVAPHRGPDAEQPGLGL